MDMREAFETEMKRIGMSVYKIGSEYQSVQDAWIAWQAACEYQREKDADIVANFEFPDQDGWNTELLADVISNQDE